MADETYDVGYGKPPRQHRFKPGHSGNPRGRPKGARGFMTIVEEALAARVTLTEGGKRKQVSTAAANLKRLIQKAVGEGDQRAIDRVLELSWRVSADRAVGVAAPDEDDLAVLELFASGIREKGDE